jgi:hypothetical protein
MEHGKKSLFCVEKGAVTVTIKYGFVNPKVQWISDEVWSCDRHTPPARIPERMETCWYYGCPSCRPPRNGEKIETKSTSYKTDNWISGWKSESPACSKENTLEEELIRDTPTPKTEKEPKKNIVKRPKLSLVLEEPLIMDTPNPETLIDSQKEQNDWEVIAKALKEYQEKGPTSLSNQENKKTKNNVSSKNQKKQSKEKPETISEEKPTDAERKRGATQKVFCSVCNKVLWRRPKDAAVRKIFWCAEHLNKKTS